MNQLSYSNSHVIEANRFHTVAVDTVVWLIACICTLCGLCFKLVAHGAGALFRISFTSIIYTLLVVLFICGFLLLTLASIISLGAVSLP